MIHFPKSTDYDKRIPKQKFYDKLELSSKIEEQFVQKIVTIFWKNKLSPETLNVSEGTNVKEIEILEINLKERDIGKNLIELIDREIPYHIVFVLRYLALGQLWISYKEDSKNRTGKFKVDSYYKTKWMPYEELTLELTGLNLDTIYENFILQIADGKLKVEEGSGIKGAVEQSKEMQKLEQQIQKLESQIQNEKQFNRQVELMAELRELKEKQSELGGRD